MRYARLVLAAFAASACGYSQPVQPHDAQPLDTTSADARLIDAAADATNVDASELVTIQQVQSAAMAPGTPVALAGVIITAIDSYGAKTGAFWVEEPGGGAYSGVEVFRVDAAGFTVGDVVSLSGMEKVEFALSSDTSGRSETEIQPPTGSTGSMTKTGHTAVPAPAIVDALAIEQLTEPAQSQEWNKWDGVLVTLPNVKEKTAPAAVGMTDPTLQSISITGNAIAETDLAAFPGGLGANTCLASVTGIIQYFFTYQILPRSTTETVTGGTACPP